MDDDGYPTEATLEAIKNWSYEDFHSLMDFIKSAWAYPDFWSEENTVDEFFADKKIIRYHVSTAGWSGNESMIRAMQDNFVFWAFSWVQSRRGGHYIFELPQEKTFVGPSDHEPDKEWVQ